MCHSRASDSLWQCNLLGSLVKMEFWFSWSGMELRWYIFIAEAQKMITLSMALWHAVYFEIKKTKRTEKHPQNRHFLTFCFSPLAEWNSRSLKFHYLRVLQKEHSGLRSPLWHFISEERFNSYQRKTEECHPTWTEVVTSYYCLFFRSIQLPESLILLLFGPIQLL